LYIESLYANISTIVAVNLLAVSLYMTSMSTFPYDDFYCVSNKMALLCKCKLPKFH